MTAPLDTSRLLRRTTSSTTSVTRLAQLQGATHRLTLDDRTITYYRVTGDRVEAATAFREDDTWTLSRWCVRSIARLPISARPI